MGSDNNDNLELYKEYNKTLRTWLVAYGIALPALFITSKDAKEFLLGINNYKVLIGIFLIAVACQIIGTIINKYVSWCAYYRDDCKSKNIDCSKFADAISKLENSIAIDIVFDVITVVLFVAATIWLLLANP